MILYKRWMPIFAWLPTRMSGGWIWLKWTKELVMVERTVRGTLRGWRYRSG